MSSQKGFSLIELAIVMAIMAMLAAASVPSIVESINQSRAGLVIQETQTLLDAARLTGKRSDHGQVELPALTR